MIRGITWLPDGTGLLISAIDHLGAPEQIWLVSYPGGIAHRLTTELAAFEDVTITADGSTIVTNQTGRQADIWLTSVSDQTRATKLTADGRNYHTASLAPDGRIAYDLATALNGSADIWLMEAEAAKGSN